MPTVMFFKNGEKVDEIVGAGSAAKYEEKISQVL